MKYFINKNEDFMKILLVGKRNKNYKLLIIRVLDME